MITNLGELIERVLDWADASNISDDVAKECVQSATHIFNYGAPGLPPLRTRDMMEQTALTSTNGKAPLPADYLQVRSVTLATATPRLLNFISPDDAVSMYGNNAAGLSNSFTLIGNEIGLYPSNNSNVTLVYYQKIPDLVDDDDTNWVLEKHPSLYLHTALYNVGLYRRDGELTEIHATQARTIMDGVGGTDMVGTYGYTQIRPRGMVIA